MSNIKDRKMIPERAKFILKQFSDRGYETYLVGGCVRDMIMSRLPHDWDIATQATPEEIISIVDAIKSDKDNLHHLNTIPTGVKHGTVTIVVDGEGFEVTTFRSDEGYSDNRRPDSVQFVKNIKDDLSRRDFTINAIAFNFENGFVDPFDGIKDIENKTIRCVGDPDERFKEDGLRILRAIRFSVQLGFYIEPKTKLALLRNSNLIKNLSSERITSEFNKIICYSSLMELLEYREIFFEFIPELKSLDHFEQYNPYHILDVLGHTAEASSALPKDSDLIARLAVLFHDIGKPKCFTKDEDGIGHFTGHHKVGAEMTDEIMRRLRYDNDTREKVCQLVLYHDTEIKVGGKYVKRVLNKIGEEQFRRLLLVKRADIIAQNIRYANRLDDIDKIENLLEKVLEDKSCFSLKDLEVNGNDLISIGFSQGKELGAALTKILDLVISGDVVNSGQELLNVAEKILKGNFAYEETN